MRLRYPHWGRRVFLRTLPTVDIQKGCTQDSLAGTEKSPLKRNYRLGHNHISTTRVSQTRSPVLGLREAAAGKPSHPPCQPGSREPVLLGFQHRARSGAEPPSGCTHPSGLGLRPSVRIHLRRHLGSERSAPRPGPLTRPAALRGPPPARPQPCGPLDGDLGAGTQRPRE